MVLGRVKLKALNTPPKNKYRMGESCHSSRAESHGHELRGATGEASFYLSFSQGRQNSNSNGRLKINSVRDVQRVTSKRI